MKLGIIIIGYDRYPLLLTSLNSLSACNWHSTRFVLVDDCSPDPKIEQTFKDFSEYEKGKGNESKFLQPTGHKGLPGLSHLFRFGIKECQDCDYLFFVPDDVIYNPFMAEAVTIGAKLLKEYKALAFMEDTRGPLFGIQVQPKRFDGYHATTHVDGFGVLMAIETVKGLDWAINDKEAQESGRSLIWRSISHQIKGNIIATDESLIEHIGNFYNATLKKEKGGEKKIYAINLNLFDKPGIIQ